MNRSSSSSRFPLLFLTLALASALVACGGEDLELSSGSGADLGDSDQGGSVESSAGLTTCTDAPASPILTELRANLNDGMLKYAWSTGWPAQVSTGCFLFVSTDSSLDRLAGDHNGWVGETMKADTGFRWLVRGASPGNKYKFTNGTSWVADRWSRSYNYDSNGEISLILPATAHLDRHFNVYGQGLPGRTVRVWVPQGTRTHVLYVHDGQNLFDPYSAWGGWRLQESAPAGMLLVGIDNTGSGRMDEYTHVQDKIGGGFTGGKGDAYADFVKLSVRPLIASKYGEPAKRGTMGSSLGGLISFHLADRHPGDYMFAASMSGTMGWGKIGTTNQTMIERYAARGKGTTKLYLDSGGTQVACADTDGDGIKDDVSGGDNYCENNQMRDTLAGLGYQFQTDLWHWWEPNAQHNEAAWAKRAWRPMQIFAGM